MRRLLSIVAVGMLMVPLVVIARGQAPAHQFLNMGTAPYDVVVVMLK